MDQQTHPRRSGSYTANLLGNIRSHLAGLQGYDVMALELIQNADDAKAESVVFDITDRGLLVVNSGKFTYCGDLHTRPCSFIASDNYSCDYHRIADVGSEGKLSRGENIGRFGIGFVSTYQVTDHPEILSSGIKLTLHPEEGQWFIEPFEQPEGTTFFLPWADDPNTEARLALGVSHVSAAHIDQLVEDFQKVLRKSLLSLRHDRTGEVRRNGELLFACDLDRGDRSDLIVSFGLVTVITFGVLWGKMKNVGITAANSKRRMDVVAVILSVFMLTYVNVVKNPAEWTKNKAGEGQTPDRLIPERMKAPFFEWINLSAETWFNLAWFAVMAAFLAMLIVHLRRPIAAIPHSWLGKGQLIYLSILWIMILADFERSMNGFNENRLVTEWVVFIHGAISRFLILALPRPPLEISPLPPASFPPRREGVDDLVADRSFPDRFAYALLTYRIFGQEDLPGAQYRWGPKAKWRIKPNLKNGKHR